MEYCIVENGVIVNMIVAEADFAEEIGALPAYEGAAMGGAYTPPPPEPEPPTTDERLEKLESENSKLKSQIQMQAQQQEFLENCLLEMGDVVYA
nr:MAG TPA: signaling protein [Caudoviricetes sp.]